MEYKVLKYFRLSIDKTGKDIINLSTGSIINISVLKKYGVQGEKLERFILEGLLEKVNSKQNKVDNNKKELDLKQDAIVVDVA
jgi:hypothetical protein